jgi:hypothetical protein
MRAAATSARSSVAGRSGTNHRNARTQRRRPVWPQARLRPRPSRARQQPSPSDGSVPFPSLLPSTASTSSAPSPTAHATARGDPSRGFAVRQRPGSSAPRALLRCFLLSELLVELAADRGFDAQGETARVGDVAAATVKRSVLLRIGRLPELASRLAQAVAVLGDGAELREAAALAAVVPPSPPRRPMRSPQSRYSNLGARCASCIRSCATPSMPTCPLRRRPPPTAGRPSHSKTGAQNQSGSPSTC